MLTIELTTEIEQKLKEIAAQNGQTVSDFVRQTVENEIINGHSKNGGDNKELIEAEENKEDKPHPLLRFAGMFSSGKTDTASRAKEILRAEIGRNGFGDFEK